jgi:hypothetical protein
VGILALTGNLVAGPPGSGLGNFPASTFADGLLLGVAGSQGKPYTYSADSTSRMVNSPSAFQPIPGIGPGGDVSRVDTLYFKCDAPVVLQKTFDDGTGRTPGPVGGGIASVVAGTHGYAKIGTNNPHNLQAGDLVTVSLVTGCAEVNGTFQVLSFDLDATHFDVPVELLNVYGGGGAVAYDAIQVQEPVNGLTLQEYNEANALLGLAVKGAARITFFACGLS